MLLSATSLGAPVAFLVVGATVIGVIALLWLLLRIDLVRKRKSLAPDVEWRADAVVYGRELEPFTAVRLRGISGATQVAGWMEVGREGIVWRPRPRFARRGAPLITASWEEVSELTSASASSAKVRWLAEVDVFSLQLSNRGSLAIFVTTPGPVHAALGRLGRSAVRLPSDWDGGTRT